MNTMMINIPLDEILTTGCNVLDCRLDADQLTIAFDHLVQETTREVINNILLMIFGWSNFMISKFVAPTPFVAGGWEKVSGFEPLGSVDVIRVAENRLTLEGRGRRDQEWLRYDFYDPQYRVTC